MGSGASGESSTFTTWRAAVGATGGTGMFGATGGLAVGSGLEAAACKGNAMSDPLCEATEVAGVVGEGSLASRELASEIF